MEKITCYTRAISKGNPGPSAIAIVLVDVKGKVLKEVSETIGNAGSEYAEYFAVVRGLQSLIEHFGAETKNIAVQIKLTDESVQKQLSSEEIVSNPGLISLFMMIHNMYVESLSEISVVYVPEKENIIINETLNKLLDAR